MGWNHRLMRHRDKLPNGDIDEVLVFHEVYYKDGTDEVDGWTENGITIVGETVDDIRWNLDKMIEALNKPILDYETGKEINNNFKEKK